MNRQQFDKWAQPLIALAIQSCYGATPMRSINTILWEVYQQAIKDTCGEEEHESTVGNVKEVW